MSTKRVMPWSFLLALPALLGACSGSRNDAHVLRLMASLDSLRTTGAYEEAGRIAGALAHATETGRCRPWQRVESERLTALLLRIRSLSPRDRREMTVADSLTPVITRLMNTEEDYVAASSSASRQLEIRSRLLGPEDPEAAASLDFLGQIARLAGEGEKAEQYLSEAITIRRSSLGFRHPDVARTLHHLGVAIQEDRGDTWAEHDLSNRRAEACYREALSILRSAFPEDDPTFAPVLQSLGSLNRVNHHYEEAEQLYVRALAIRRRSFGPKSLEVANNLLWLGYCRLCAGKREPAREALEEARELYREMGMSRSHSMGDVSRFLANISWLEDDYEKAAVLWRESSRCPNISAVSQPVGYNLRRIPGLDAPWIDDLLCAGREEEAWQEFCRGSGPIARSLLNLRMARESWSGAGRLDTLGARVLNLRQQLARPGSSGVSSTGADGDKPDAADSLRVELSRLEAERGLLEQKILSRVPEDSLSLDRLQGFLGPDQAMIGWVFSKWSWNPPLRKYSLWAFVIRNQGKVRWTHLGVWHTVEDYSAWREEIARLDRTILRASDWPHRVLPDSSLGDDARKVYEKVFAPFQSDLDGVRNIVVVEDRFFWPSRIYPECLVDRDGVLLNGRFTFSYTPSPWAFVHLGESARSRRPAPEDAIVAVGDPLGNGDGMKSRSTRNVTADGIDDPGGRSGIDPATFRGALSGDPGALERLPALPWARKEARRARSVFPRGSVLLGPEATEGSLRSLVGGIPDLGVLHFATHALVDVAEPDRSALVMARRPALDSGADFRNDGLITADEVMLGWNLDADLVTLSGCETVQGMRAMGGEDLGFAQAFFAAGARNLLMSRWKVDDRATSLLMGRFYENLTGSYTDRRNGVAGVPMGKAEALREAQSWLRDFTDGRGRNPFAHPVYWAGFILIGNSG